MQILLGEDAQPVLLWRVVAKKRTFLQRAF